MFLIYLLLSNDAQMNMINTFIVFLSFKIIAHFRIHIYILYEIKYFKSHPRKFFNNIQYLSAYFKDVCVFKSSTNLKADSKSKAIATGYSK